MYKSGRENFVIGDTNIFDEEQATRLKDASTSHLHKQVEAKFMENCNIRLSHHCRRVEHILFGTMQHNVIGTAFLCPKKQITIRCSIWVALGDPLDIFYN